MKLTRIAPIALAGLMLSALAIPAAAKSDVNEAPSESLPAGTLIYYEDFDDISATDTDAALSALGWEKSEGFKDFTAILSATDGYLHIDNLDATVGASNDSYAYVLDDAYCANFVNQPYTYQYEVTYRDAENSYRYLSLLLYYNGMDTYNTVDLRIRGDGYNQLRQGSDWPHYNSDDCPLGSHGDDAIITTLYGITFDENVMARQDKTVTIRVEVHPENGCTVFIDDVLVSKMEQNEDLWPEMTANASAIAFKTSTKLLADFDNLMIWTGNGVDPDLTVLEPVVEEIPADEAPADEAPVSTPETADAGLAVAAAIMTAAAGVILTKKK